MKTLRNLLMCAVLLFATACSNVKANQTKEQETVTIELPAGAVEMKYQHHLYCKVMLRDSIPARMIFDTGCTNLLLDSIFYAERFAKDGNLRKAMLGGAGGGMEMANIDASKWAYRIGEESITENMAIVLNLRKIVGNDADGMFGMAFMKGKRVEFNYANNYMRFLPAMRRLERISLEYHALGSIITCVLCCLYQSHLMMDMFLMETSWLIPACLVRYHSIAQQLID